MEIACAYGAKNDSGTSKNQLLPGVRERRADQRPRSGQPSIDRVFPRTADELVPEGPVELVWCSDCGLLQMAHSCDPTAMYGENYGYRSGLNASMVRHLSEKMRYLQRIVSLDENSVVLDIGSNDATSLKAYEVDGLTKIGIDPTGGKFKYYSDDIKLVEDFFSSDAYRSVEARDANIITSIIAMFYDLEDPTEFAKQISDVLDDNGIWHFEQSYMPSMLGLTPTTLFVMST